MENLSEVQAKTLKVIEDNASLSQEICKLLDRRKVSPEVGETVMGYLVGISLGKRDAADPGVIAAPIAIGYSKAIQHGGVINVLRALFGDFPQDGMPQPMPMNVGTFKI